MRDLIKNILREQEDIERIKKNQVLISKLTPKIVEYIKGKYGKGVRVRVTNKDVFFASDNYSATCKEFKVYVEDESLVPAEVKYQLWKGINSNFGLNMSEYGSCIYFTVYKKMWYTV